MKSWLIWVDQAVQVAIHAHRAQLALGVAVPKLGRVIAQLAHVGQQLG